MKGPSSHLIVFGLYPPPETADQIADAALKLARDNGLVGRRTPADRLHVTLQPVAHARKFGQLDQTVADACIAAAGLRASAFRLAFDRVVSWTNNGGMFPFVLKGGEGVFGAEALHRALQAALVDILPTEWRGGYREPHLTLLWDRMKIDEAFLDQPIDWLVEDFALIHSIQGEGRHEVLGRWPLMPIPDRWGGSYATVARRRMCRSAAAWMSATTVARSKT